MAEKKIKFRTAFDRSHDISMNAGSDFIKDYRKDIDDDGQVQIVGTDRNLTDEINAQKDACNLENMLRKASLGDDTALIQRDDLMYYDTVGMPKNIIEANNFIEKAKLEFNSLPIELRKMFDNNVEEYARQYGSKDFGEKLDSYFNPPAPTVDPVPVVKGDVNNE